MEFTPTLQQRKNIYLDIKKYMSENTNLRPDFMGLTNNHYLCLALVANLNNLTKPLYVPSYTNIDKYFPEVAKYLPLIQHEKEILALKRGNTIDSWGRYAEIAEDLKHINTFRIKCLNSMIRITNNLIREENNNKFKS